MGNTVEEIKQRLLARIPPEFDKTEGSFFYDLLAAVAIELEAVYAGQDNALKLGFAQTTSGKYLDYRAAENGLTRLAATKATGTVTITGSAGTVIPAGSLFASGAGVQYQTTAEVTIGPGGTVDAPIEAVEAGSAGNVPASTITSIPISIAGVSQVTNAAPTTGGTDTETDAALVARLLEKVRRPATSGNAAHYLQWAKEVNGVGDARVLPLWNGPGTVKVVVIDGSKQPASAEIVSSVASHIENVRPIGAAVTVESAAGIYIDVAATLTLDTGAVLADIQAAFESSLDEYLKKIAFQQSYVSYAVIGSLLLDTPGVLDYSGLTVNGGTANIPVGATQVAVKGTVALS